MVRITTSDPRRVLRELRKAHANLMKQLVFFVVMLLRENTPKKTGHASNNYQTSIGSPADGIDGSPEAPSRAASDSSLARVLSSYEGEGPIHVTNNVDYLEKLNNGSSSQAPAGFVQASVEQAARIVESRNGVLIEAPRVDLR